MLQILLTFFFLNTNGIVIRIVDSNTKEAIPYATVTSSKFHGVSNMYGQIQLTGNVDSISVRCVGYEQQDLRVRDIKNEKGEFTVYLNPKRYSIDEVRITPIRIKKIPLGYFKEPSFSIYTSCLGGQVALYFPPDKRNRYLGLPISTVSYFIRPTHNFKKKFRVRLYAVNEKDGSPDYDLLPEAVYTHAERGNSWVNVDIRKYNIQFPANGFFAAIEFLPDSVQLTQNFMDTFNTLDLGGNLEDKNNGRTWMTNRFGYWYKDIPRAKDVIVGNAMIKVELYKETKK